MVEKKDVHLWSAQRSSVLRRIRAKRGFVRSNAELASTLQRETPAPSTVRSRHQRATRCRARMPSGVAEKLRRKRRSAGSERVPGRRSCRERKVGGARKRSSASERVGRREVRSRHGEAVKGVEWE